MAHSDKKRLAGKVAIITGSGRGIGRCEALLMAQQGAKIVVSDIGTDTDGTRTAGKVAEEIRAAAVTPSRQRIMSPRWRARSTPSRQHYSRMVDWTSWSITPACEPVIQSTSSRRNNGIWYWIVISKRRLP